MVGNLAITVAARHSAEKGDLWAATRRLAADRCPDCR
jgi:hypothetical protein